MTTKTDFFLPKFYLVNTNLSIAITKNLLIGRTVGDVILEDEKLSSTHCEITFSVLELTIKDLNSKNGIFVNRLKINPGESVKLSPGDLVRIGSEEYYFVNNEEDKQKYSGKVERRKHVIRSQDLYSFGSIFSFFNVSNGWRGLYIALILLTLGLIITNLRLEIPVPEKIGFLSELYNEILVSNGLKALFLVWIICSLHSFLIATRLKQNPFIKFLTLAPFLGAISFMINIDGPAWFIKNYAQDRKDVYESHNFEDRAIVHLKTVTQLQKRLNENFLIIQTKINQKDKLALQYDLDSLNNHIADNLDKATKRKLGKSSARNISSTSGK